MFSDPLKGPIAAQKFFWPPAAFKCLRLVKYKQLRKRSTKRLTHAFWQLTTQLPIFSQATRIFRASSNLVFTEYCAIIWKQGAIYFVNQ